MNTTTKEISFDQMLLNDCFALEDALTELTKEKDND